MISESLVSNASINALISISEDDDLEPPRARPRETMSPSRVTTVTDGWDLKIASAAFAFSATTVDASNEASKSPIDEERMCADNGFKPAGIVELALCPGSYTRTSA